MAVCPECGGQVMGLREVASFCSTTCRKAFNNRRAVRGAALYDLWMAQRYQRSAAKLVGCFALMCALGQEYREQDLRTKGHGWQSWLDPIEVLARKPWLRAKVLQLTRRAKPKGS